MWQPYNLYPEQQKLTGLKLHIGPNCTYLPTFLNIDIDPNNPVADIIADGCKLSTVFKNNTVDIILCSHILEHMPILDALNALDSWHNLLRPGGWLILELPDCYKCCKFYLEAIDQDRYDATYDTAIIGIQGRPDWSHWQTHKTMWSIETLTDKLKLYGFNKIMLREPTDKPSKIYSMRLDAQK